MESCDLLCPASFTCFQSSPMLSHVPVPHSLRPSNIPLYTAFCLSIPTLMDTDWFHLSASVKNAAMDIHVHIFVDLFLPDANPPSWWE